VKGGKTDKARWLENQCREIERITSGPLTRSCFSSVKWCVVIVVLDADEVEQRRALFA